MPHTRMPCFLRIPFLCHPILQYPLSLGGIFLSRSALPGGVFRARRLAKATRPLTCTHFDPARHPRFPLHFWLHCTACQHSWGYFYQIAPNRAERVPGGQFIHFFQTRPQIATRTATGGNKAFRLPIRTHQFHSSKELEGYCRIYRNRKKRSSFDKTPCPCFSYCQLCCHSTQTSACNAIPACFQLIVTGLLSQVFFLFGFYKPFLLS